MFQSKMVPLALSSVTAPSDRRTMRSATWFPPQSGCSIRHFLSRYLRRERIAAASLAALACASLSHAPAARADAFTINAPIQVPLHWIPISAGFSTVPMKLGIYAALGGSTTPQLFEFDTGGSGFYPTYAAGTPWWGGAVTKLGSSFAQSYDGGRINYAGQVVSTSVSLFADPSSLVFTVPEVILGQTETITSGQKQTWPLASPYTPPPLENGFWGDFGMAPKQGKKGVNANNHEGNPTLDSLISQLIFGGDVVPGYRVHAGASPWVQFGLAAQDLLKLDTTYHLEITGDSSPNQVPYTKTHEVIGKVLISNGSKKFEDDHTGIIFDTGAFTTIHQGSRSIHRELIQDHPTRVAEGAQVAVSSRSDDPSGQRSWVPFLSLEAGTIVDEDLVMISDAGDYYLNTGILPFLSNDIIVNLKDAQLTLVPQSVPAPFGVSGLTVAATLSRRLRQLRRRLRLCEKVKP